MQKITLERLPTYVTRESEPQESWNRNRDAIAQFFTQLLCEWQVTSQIEATRTTLAPVTSLKKNLIHAGIPIYRYLLQDAHYAVKGSFNLHHRHERQFGPGFVAHFGSRYERNKAGIPRTQ